MTPPLSAEPAPSREPLDVPALTAAAAAVGLDLTVVDEIDSTNVELARLARAGGQDRRVLVAERQTAGRGRLDRSWVSPPGAGLTVSLLLRPTVPAAALGWLPMVAGTSLVGTLRFRLAVPAVLKWPNDVLVDPSAVAGDALAGTGAPAVCGVAGKLAGILVELVPTPGARPAAVIGFGLNVTTTAQELPPGGTSLLLCGATGLDRTALLEALLTDLVVSLQRWELEPDQARPAYRAVCATLGRTVRLELPDGSRVQGVASDVDEAGRLIVDGQPFSAADVVHLR